MPELSSRQTRTKIFVLDSFILFVFHIRWMHKGRWDEGLNQMKSWIQEGKVKPKETIIHGFENLPHAFIGMLQGQNLGKMIVKA